MCYPLTKGVIKMSNERELFEQWAIQKHFCIDEIALEESLYREYSERITQTAWEAWQAAGASTTMQDDVRKDAWISVLDKDGNYNIPLKPCFIGYKLGICDDEEIVVKFWDARSAMFNSTKTRLICYCPMALPPPPPSIDKARE